jgi:Na+/melibiose symporter-like transporter
MSFKIRFREAQDGKRFSYLFTAIIGLGFFTTAITWVIYNVYIPTYLKAYLRDVWGTIPIETFIIGSIMVLDNVIAVLMQPWIGNISDKTWKRYGPNKKGRRMPFIIIGVPLAAVFFVLVGVFGYDLFSANSDSFFLGFILLLLVIGGFKGIGALVGLFAFPMIEKINTFWAYIFVSAILIICLIILYFTIKEPEVLKDVEKKEKVKVIPTLREIFKREDKSLVFILFAIFAWFFGYNVVETFFSNYGEDVLLMAKGDISMIFGVMALTFIIFAFPAGLIAKKIGRKQCILAGLGIFVVFLGTAAVFSLANFPALAVRTTFIGMDIPYLALLYAGCFFFMGIAWALININSIVIVWELSGKDKIGMGTGIYYFFSAAAAITGPVIIGGILDLINFGLGLEEGEQYKYLFLFAVIFFLIAGILTYFVKKTGVEGESGDLPPEGKPEKIEPIAE